MKIPSDKITLSSVTLQSSQEAAQQNATKTKNGSDKNTVILDLLSDQVDISKTGSDLQTFLSSGNASSTERRSMLDLLKAKIDSGEYLQSLSSTDVAKSFNNEIALEIGTLGGLYANETDKSDLPF